MSDTKTRVVCPTCETIIDAGNFMAWGAGRCPGCGWYWWWDSGTESPEVDWARTPTSRSKGTEAHIQVHCSKPLVRGTKKPQIMPCARCPSHFFDPDPKGKPSCIVKIEELKVQMEAEMDQLYSCPVCGAEVRRRYCEKLEEDDG